MENKNRVQVKLETEEFINNADENSEYQFLSEAIQRKNKNQAVSIKKQPRKQTSSKKVNKLKYFQCNRCNNMCLTKKDIIKHLKIHDREIYKCTKCDRAFTSKKSLSYHMKSHAGIKYECDICKKQFNDKSNMKKHRNIHLKIKQYKCEQCPRTFSDPTGFKQHMEQHAGIRFKCKFCTKIYANRQYLKRHVENHLKINDRTKKLYTCDKCTDSCFKYKHHLEEHKIKHHRDKQYECYFCQKMFYSRAAIYGHMQFHILEFKCTHCCKRFSAHKYLKRHIEAWHENHSFCCIDCEKMFRSKQLLKDHRRRIHPVAKAHVCLVCGAAFPLKSLLRKHNARVHENKNTFIPYQCLHCSFKCKWKQTLSRHIRIIHLNEDVVLSQFECAVCKKIYRRKFDLKDHIEADHLKTNIYYCDLCEFSSYRKDGIRKHKWNHPFMEYHCKHCKEKFTDVELFRSHLSKHLVKPLQCNDHKWKKYVAEFKQLYSFECNSCNDRFTKLINLKRHIKRIHCDHIQWQCDLCEKSFIHLSNLKSHVEAIHLGITYQCVNCYHSYKIKSSLSRHVRLGTCHKKKALSQLKNFTKFETKEENYDEY